MCVNIWHLCIRMMCARLCTQVWDSVSARMKKDLTYQADDMFMMHDQAVLALAFSRDSELLVSGT